LEKAKSSKGIWESYEETEQDKNVYTKKIAPLSERESSLESLPEQEDEDGSP